MKKPMKRLLSVTLVFALLASLLTISAGAALPPVLVGDVNRDDSVDIIDVTLIQRALAGITDFGYETELIADYDRDSEMSIIDATWLQRKEANITVPEGYGGILDQNIQVTSFYADYDSGKATPNVPVTFTARANCGDEGCTYEFYVDGVKVQERSYTNTFIYTFPESGTYNVEVKAYNPDGFCLTIPYSYFAELYDSPYCYSGFTVVDSYPYDELGLLSVHWIDYSFTPDPVLEVQATGGTEPYTYSYTILDLDNGDTYSEDYYESLGWTMRYDQDEQPYLYRDFSEDTTLMIPVFELGFHYERRLVVQAKDAKGNLTEPVTVIVEDEMIIG